ncbi:hypothetical protein CUC43_34340 (plasmid) [Bacillus thuringiensis LM1212]|uniref:hypothetical protein n=1 Tax=Bacillus cereus group TaxID=86661 RepID=UPI0004263540|nr:MULTISPECIES: hypothetical protein [Bacillus cereus group]AXY11616.1 hypothetical protein CUC43_34255 [Bacillus thuringiensis LM1212]AXY11632.1 hypothetical protein CUC43_34340 [Bacillus thuringiensis LM1212]QDF27469.1 hypothetical protein FJR70_32600 [Bacillus tropicus]QDF27484.1 hypothetical protein FJR70_32685 [Bacillus tropicus]QUG99361.1 hypothetical protein HCM98_31625 [Bacillus tropicus]
MPEKKSKFETFYTNKMTYYGVDNIKDAEKAYKMERMIAKNIVDFGIEKVSEWIELSKKTGIENRKEKEKKD